MNEKRIGVVIIVEIVWRMEIHVLVKVNQKWWYVV